MHSDVEKDGWRDELKESLLLVILSLLLFLFDIFVFLIQLIGHCVESKISYFPVKYEDEILSFSKFSKNELNMSIFFRMVSCSVS